MKKELIFIIIYPLFCIVMIFGLIDWISGFQNISAEDNTIINFGYLGSFLSGVTAIIIVILTGMAVYYSYNSYLEEIKRVQQQRLEDRFYHLLAMHRENIGGMTIDLKNNKLENSKVILNMFRELETIVKIFKIKKMCEDYGYDFNFRIKKISNRDEKLLKIIKEMDEYKIYKRVNLAVKKEKKIYAEIAFLIMFLGCGERSSKIIQNYLIKFENYLNIDEVLRLFSNENFRNDIKNIYNFKYKLFGGHQSRLGHYFRNMFHILKFIDSDVSLSFDQKMSYIKNFRVQLNTFEQALVFVNSITIFGSDWSKYMIKYKLVKNIPKDFFAQDYWFSLEDEILEMTEKHKDIVLKEHKQSVEEFVKNYFEYSSHGLNK